MTSAVRTKTLKAALDALGKLAQKSSKNIDALAFDVAQQYNIDLSPRQLANLYKSKNQPSAKLNFREIPKSLKKYVGEEKMKKTDRWYKHQPEWGTPESTRKAKELTPGEKAYIEYRNKRRRNGTIDEAKGIPFRPFNRPKSDDDGGNPFNYKLKSTKFPKIGKINMILLGPTAKFYDKNFNHIGTYRGGWKNSGQATNWATRNGWRDTDDSYNNHQVWVGGKMPELSESKESVFLDLEEGIIQDLVDKIKAGSSGKNVTQQIKGLNKAQLVSIISKASPKSAQRTLSPSDYMLWKAAYDQYQAIKEEVMSAADAGIPHDTKNMGPKLKTKVMVDRRYRKDKPPVLLKRYRKYMEDQNDK